MNVRSAFGTFGCIIASTASGDLSPRDFLASFMPDAAFSYPTNELPGLVRSIVVRDQYCAKEFIKDGSIVIDAGANVGVFARFAARLAKGAGRIYAFEPVPETFRRLTAETKGHATIALFQKGLGSEITEKKMHYSYSSLGTSTVEDSPFTINDGERTERAEIQITTIDEFVKSHSLPRVDFIKIDTEGYEKKVLEGARETIKKYKPVISASAYHLEGDDERFKQLILGICPDYAFRIETRSERDLVAFPRKI